MALVLKHHDINDLISRNKAGETVKSIAASIGCCERTISDAFHKQGHRAPLQWAAKHKFDVKAMHQEHCDGLSIFQLSKKYNLARKTICRWFDDLGLACRGLSDAQ